jgi:hypothetical protein
VKNLLPLGRELVTAFGATCGQNKTTALGRHARTETMATLAHQVRRLKCAFHRDSPVNYRPNPAKDSKAARSRPSFTGGFRASQRKPGENGGKKAVAKAAQKGRFCNLSPVYVSIQRFADRKPVQMFKVA